MRRNGVHAVHPPIAQRRVLAWSETGVRAQLYLFAAFTEAGFRLDRSSAVPDFSCESLAGEIAVEATTVNRSKVGPLADLRHSTPNAAQPQVFRQIVGDPGYSETWIEGFDVYHNPSALHPLPDWILPGAAHHRIAPDGQMHSHVPTWQPMASVTNIHINGG